MNLGRRAFVKLLGGVAALPLIGKTVWADQKKSDAAGLKLDSPGPAVKRRREYVMSLGEPSALVAPGETRTFSVTSQVIMRPERFIVPSNLAVSFAVRDLRVNKLSQFEHHQGDGVPAVVFAENSFGVRLKMDACPVDGVISVTVTNVTPFPQKFVSAIVGPGVGEFALPNDFREDFSDLPSLDNLTD